MREGEHVGEDFVGVGNDAFDFALHGVNDEDGGGHVAGDVELAGGGEFDAVGAAVLLEQNFAGDGFGLEVDDGNGVAAGGVVGPAGGAVVGDVEGLAVGGEDEFVGDMADFDAGDGGAVGERVEADGVVILFDDEENIGRVDGEESEGQKDGAHLGRVYR